MNNKKSKEKVAVVTGSSSGIGFETSLLLARKGFYTYATMRNLNKSLKIKEIAEKEKDRATSLFLQWFISEQVEEEILFQTILQKFEIYGREKLAVYQIDQSLASIRSQVVAKKQISR